MTPRRVELALKKQRLQIRSAALRETLGEHAGYWRPAFAVADRVHAGIRWLQRHPALPVAVLVALLVARPRGVLRWLKRGFFAWQSLNKLQSLLAVKHSTTL